MLVLVPMREAQRPNCGHQNPLQWAAAVRRSAAPTPAWHANMNYTGSGLSRRGWRVRSDDASRLADRRIAARLAKASGSRSPARKPHSRAAPTGSGGSVPKNPIGETERRQKRTVEVPDAVKTAIDAALRATAEPPPPPASEPVRRAAAVQSSQSAAVTGSGAAGRASGGAPPVRFSSLAREAARSDASAPLRRPSAPAGLDVQLQHAPPPRPRLAPSPQSAAKAEFDAAWHIDAEDIERLAEQRAEVLRAFCAPPPDVDPEEVSVAGSDDVHVDEWESPTAESRKQVRFADAPWEDAHSSSGSEQEEREEQEGGRRSPAGSGVAEGRARAPPRSPDRGSAGGEEDSGDDAAVADGEPAHTDHNGTVLPSDSGARAIDSLLAGGRAELERLMRPLRNAQPSSPARASAGGDDATGHGGTPGDVRNGRDSPPLPRLPVSNRVAALATGLDDDNDTPQQRTPGAGESPTQPTSPSRWDHPVAGPWVQRADMAAELSSVVHDVAENGGDGGGSLAEAAARLRAASPRRGEPPLRDAAARMRLEAAAATRPRERRKLRKAAQVRTQEAQERRRRGFRESMEAARGADDGTRPSARAAARGFRNVVDRVMADEVAASSGASTASDGAASSRGRRTTHQSAVKRMQAAARKALREHHRQYDVVADADAEARGRRRAAARAARQRKVAAARAVPVSGRRGGSHRPRRERRTAKSTPAVVGTPRAVVPPRPPPPRPLPPAGFVVRAPGVALLGRGPGSPYAYARAPAHARPAHGAGYGSPPPTRARGLVRPVRPVAPAGWTAW